MTKAEIREALREITAIRNRLREDMPTFRETLRKSRELNDRANRTLQLYDKLSDELLERLNR